MLRRGLLPWVLLVACGRTTSNNGASGADGGTPDGDIMQSGGAGANSGGSAAGLGGTSSDAGVPSGGEGGDDTPYVCGDGSVDPGEGCDDGNVTRGDGCFDCRKVIDLALGQGSACALLDDGSVKCWGWGFGGYQGVGDTENRGDDPGEIEMIKAVDLGTGRRALSITTGGFHTCAVLDDGSSKCWGAGDAGVLGRGTQSLGDEPGEMGDALLPLDLGTGRQAVAFACGGGHTCALLDNGKVKCWGHNLNGELGLGDASLNPGVTSESMGDSLPAVDLGSGRTAKEIAAGGYGSCAILDDDSLKCWGWGINLGQGTPDSRGDDPDEMGDNLPPIDLGTDRHATQVCINNVHACAVLDDQTVKCWGMGAIGQPAELGQLGDGPGEMGDNLPIVDLGVGVKAKAVSCGGAHTCALLDNDAIKCWGDSSTGQLGLGDVEFRGDEASEMGDQLPIVSLGTNSTVRLIRTGNAFSCAILDNDAVKCWGQNDTGNLGLGDVEHRGDDVDEMGSSLPVLLVP